MCVYIVIIVNKIVSSSDRIHIIIYLYYKVRRLGGQLEREELSCLPWVLCAARLCEVHAQALAVHERGEPLVALFDALFRRLLSPRMTQVNLAATHVALAAALTADAWARLWPAGRWLPPVPASLSCLSGDGTLEFTKGGLVKEGLAIIT